MPETKPSINQLTLNLTSSLKITTTPDQLKTIWPSILNES